MALQERDLLPVEIAMNREVVVCGPEDSLAHAVDLLDRYAISGMPVVDQANRVVGVISKKDCSKVLQGAVHPPDKLSTPLRMMLSKRPDDISMEKLLEILASAHRMKVKEVMSSPAVTISPRAALRDALLLLVDKGINRLPVVEDGLLKGILTRGDVLVALRVGLK